MPGFLLKETHYVMLTCSIFSPIHANTISTIQSMHYLLNTPWGILFSSHNTQSIIPKLPNLMPTFFIYMYIHTCTYTVDKEISWETTFRGQLDPRKLNTKISLRWIIRATEVATWEEVASQVNMVHLTAHSPTTTVSALQWSISFVTVEQLSFSLSQTQQHLYNDCFPYDNVLVNVVSTHEQLLLVFCDHVYKLVMSITRVVKFSRETNFCG